MLNTRALFEPELSLAVGTADIAVGLEVAYLQILALEEINHRGIYADKAVVLIQTLCYIGRERAQYRQHREHQYDNDHKRTAYKEIYQIQHSRDYPDKGIQFIVSVPAAHEFGKLL